MQQEVPPRPLRRWIRPAFFAVLVGAVITYLVFDGGQYLSLELVKSNRDTLLQYVHGHYALAVLACALIYTGTTALSVPGAVVLSLTTGFLFGRWVGTGIILVSATLGSVLVFLAVRHMFLAAAERRMGNAARRLARGFHRDGFHYLLFLRLVPVFPFWLVNIAPAFTRLPVRTYLAATALGILPGAFVFANLGQSLGRITSAEQLLSRQTLLAFFLLGMLALLPVAVRRQRNQPAVERETP